VLPSHVIVTFSTTPLPNIASAALGDSAQYPPDPSMM